MGSGANQVRLSRREASSLHTQYIFQLPVAYVCWTTNLQSTVVRQKCCKYSVHVLLHAAAIQPCRTIYGTRARQWYEFTDPESGETKGHIQYHIICNPFDNYHTLVERWTRRLQPRQDGERCAWLSILSLPLAPKPSRAGTSKLRPTCRTIAV